MPSASTISAAKKHPYKRLVDLHNQNERSKPESIEIALINEGTSDNLKEIVIEGAEISLDHFLKEGVLKEIPFFGTLYKGLNAAFGIREAIFAKKVYKFLTQVKDIPLKEREDFIKKLEEKYGYKQQVGEKLIVLLEKLDDLNKPEIIGRLFKSTIQSNLSYNEFLRLSAIVAAAYLPDLERIKEYPKTQGLNDIIKEQLANIGIMTIQLKEDRRDKGILDRTSLGGTNRTPLPPKVEYKLNILGRLLVEYGLKEVPNRHIGMRGEI